MTTRLPNLARLLLFTLIVIGLVATGAARSNAAPEAQGTPAPTAASQTGQTLDQTVQDLVQQVDDLTEQVENPPKDFWDKIDSLSGLISGVVVAVIGGLFTYFYNRRDKALQEAQHKREAAQKEQELRILRIQAMQSFMPELQSGEDKAVEAALLGINTLDSELAVQLAELFRTEGSVTALSKIASSSDKQGAQRAVPRLVSMSRSGTEELRASASEALAGLGEQEVYSRLREGLRDRDQEVRKTAARALGEIGSAEAVEPLLAALDDRDPQVRAEVALSLGKSGREGASSQLMGLLSDQAPEVRAAAATALGDLGDAQARPRLLELLQHEQEPEVREAARYAVVQIQSE